MRLPRRLSTRLTVSFICLFTATVAVIVGLTIYFANRAFESSTDDQLQGTATTAEERLRDSSDSARILEELSTAGQFLELLDANGHVIATSSNLQGARLPSFLRGNRAVSSDGFHTINLHKTQVRLVRHALTNGDGDVTGYIIVAGVTSDVGESTRNLAIILSATGALGLVAATLGTIFVSRREAAPLQELTDDVLATSASGFAEAFEPAGRGSKEARELRRAFSELIERQRELISRERAFFADSSHVLRTPLAVLQGDIEMLEQGVYGKERQEVVAQARAAIDAMSRTISGLLLLSREQERASSSWEVLNLGDLLCQLVDGARTAYPALDLEMHGDKQLDVAGDPHQVHDLFASLIENACHYTPAGGAVTVTLSRAGDDAVVEVADTGIGMTGEEAERALDRFYRGPRARRMFPGGAGLGLAIAARIASVHNGELKLSPNGEQGTVARVCLPLLD